MNCVPPADPDFEIDHWDYRLVEFDGGVRLIEVYYADEEKTAIVGHGIVSVDGDSPAELQYAIMQMAQACTDAIWSPRQILKASDLPEVDPLSFFELEEADYN